MQGNNLTLKGRYADGLQIDKRLVGLRPQDPLAHYNLACSFALLRKPVSFTRSLPQLFRLPQPGVALLGKRPSDRPVPTRAGPIKMILHPAKVAALSAASVATGGVNTGASCSPGVHGARAGSPSDAVMRGYFDT